MALGSAAVLAVYGAGFVKTRSAAARFDVESVKRRPAAPAPVVVAPIAVASAPETSVVATVAPARTVKTSAPVAAVIDSPAASVPEKPVAAIVAPKVDSVRAVAATDTAAKAPAGYKDGIYTGWGSSRHGDIQSQVEIRNGRIISASIAQCLTRYSCSWISALPGQVVTRQSSEVDYVSGATESTNAFYYGIVDALKKAK